MLSKIQPTISKNWKVQSGLIQGSPKKLKRRIPQISKKKQQRIKDTGGEWKFFLLIWDERDHCCEECGRVISEPQSFCFSHKLSKGRYPEYRLNPKNIALVCSMECHKSHDTKNIGKDIEIIKYLNS